MTCFIEFTLILLCARNKFYLDCYTFHLDYKFQNEKCCASKRGSDEPFKYIRQNTAKVHKIIAKVYNVTRKRDDEKKERKGYKEERK